MRHVTTAAALVSAVAFAAGAGWSWWSAAHDPQVHRAEQRREVLMQARESIATLTTMDGRDVEAGLRAWRAASTGPLHDELTGPAAVDRLRGQPGTTGRVVDLAVTELEERTATVLAAVDTEVTRDGARPETTGSRLEAELSRTPQGWRVSALAPVGLGAVGLGAA